MTPSHVLLLVYLVYLAFSTVGHTHTAVTSTVDGQAGSATALSIIGSLLIIVTFVMLINVVP